MYQLTNTTTIIRLVDNASIPIDERNRDYQSYLSWLAEGNTPLPAPAEPPPEATVPLESRVGLLEDAVEALILEGIEL